MGEPIPLRGLYSEDLIHSVGLLFLTAASCEAALSFQAARCIAHPGVPSVQTHFSTAGMEVSLKLRTIEYCVHLCEPSALARVEKITGSIRRLFEHRNHIAHNIGVQSPKHIEIHVLKITRKGVAANKTFTACQIEGFANLIHARSKQLHDCLNEIGIVKLAGKK